MEQPDPTVRIEGYGTFGPPVPGNGPITNLLFENGRLVACRDGITYELVDEVWRTL